MHQACRFSHMLCTQACLLAAEMESTQKADCSACTGIQDLEVFRLVKTNAALRRHLQPHQAGAKKLLLLGEIGRDTHKVRNKPTGSRGR